MLKPLLICKYCNIICVDPEPEKDQPLYEVPDGIPMASKNKECPQCGESGPVLIFAGELTIISV